MFEEQVNTDIFVGDIVYAIGIVAVLLAATGVMLLDMGLVRKKNAIDSVVQKMVAGFVCALAFAPIGYALWVWQINEAFGVPNPLGQAIEDWWIGGTAVNALPQSLDPAVYPAADQFQVFYVLFVIFAIFFGVVIQTAGTERMRPVGSYALAFSAGAIVLPLLYYLVWGSTSPLTNWGVHDSVGSLAVYLPLGAMGLVAAWRVGPRIGRFGDSDEPDPPGPTNIPFVAVGIMLVIPALTFFALVAGYVVPGVGFLGISMTSTGFGILLENLFAAIVAGGLAGAVLSYRTRNPYWAIAGPFAGYVSCGSLFDVGRPWYVFLIALGAPIVALLTVQALNRLRIDENKLVPLILGPAVYGGLVGGFTEWGEATGGFIGIDEGEFAFQNAEITPWGQLVGIAVAVGLAATVALIVCLIVERLTGLRVPERVELEGMDARYWPPPATTAVTGDGDGIGLPAEVDRSTRLTDPAPRG